MKAKVTIPNGMQIVEITENQPKVYEVLFIDGKISQDEAIKADDWSMTAKAGDTYEGEGFSVEIIG